jgi:hypothetical protein
MRNFHAREREKIMMGGFHSGSYQEPEEEKRVDELVKDSVNGNSVNIRESVTRKSAD